ncbi:lithostathine-like [Zootoca vivipara]|uniref:lithostathine-like n=1 Tax=Zootoca vivipara TaxID=8524 RepID=UPI00293B885D|nr:lithostathine-like [Zootoca vivipara]
MWGAMGLHSSFITGRSFLLLSLQKLIWYWNDGSVFSQPLWDGRSISTSISTYECVSLSPSGSTKWTQRSCTTSLPFLCKFKASY